VTYSNATSILSNEYSKLRGGLKTGSTTASLSLTVKEHDSFLWPMKIDFNPPTIKCSI
jgi:hypothetical protein